jgi:hypothetical protein
MLRLMACGGGGGIARNARQLSERSFAGCLAADWSQVRALSRAVVTAEPVLNVRFPIDLVVAVRTEFPAAIDLTETNARVGGAYRRRGGCGHACLCSRPLVRSSDAHAKIPHYRVGIGTSPNATATAPLA